MLKAQGSRIKAQESRLKDQGSRNKDQCSRLKAQGSRLKAHGSRLTMATASLHDAAREGDVAKGRAALDAGAGLEDADAGGFTAMHCACLQLGPPLAV